MKPDTLNFKPFPFFLLHLYPLYHLIIFLICFIVYLEKLRKRSQFEKVWWNKKNEISRIRVKFLIYPPFHIFLSYCQIHHNLSFQHTHTHTHTHTYIYIPFLGCLFSVQRFTTIYHFNTHTHTHIHTYIYIYIYI